MLLELLTALTLSGEIVHVEGAMPSQETQSQPTQSQPVQATPAHDYVREVTMGVGCPYMNYADYLTHCRADKRESAWKRIIKEDWLFFDKSRIKRFEAISKKYSIL